ncbi:MAG: DUF4864 domain-containing protein [Pseudomonadota bacterium]
MRALLIALVLLLSPPALGADDLAGNDRAAIQTVIQSQLDAFQRDDGVAAFGFASPMIQDLFRTPEGFMAMVKRGYAPVYRPQQVVFQDLVTMRGKPTQRVWVVGPDGRAVIAYYVMEQQADGTWRIDGCILEPVSDAEA